MFIRDRHRATRVIAHCVTAPPSAQNMQRCPVAGCCSSSHGVGCSPPHARQADTAQSGGRRLASKTRDVMCRNRDGVIARGTPRIFPRIGLGTFFWPGAAMAREHKGGIERRILWIDVRSDVRLPVQAAVWTHSYHWVWVCLLLGCACNAKLALYRLGIISIDTTARDGM